MTDYQNYSLEKIKLLKYLTSCGIASRRDSFDMIKQGKICVNGKIINEPSYIIEEEDSVSINGKKISFQKKVYIILNKPKGYTCTNGDPHAELKAIDLIKIKERIFSVGRLDKESEGLIIFTNDGDYSNRLIHPSSSILKQYEVTLSGNLSTQSISALLRGIQDNGESLKAVSIKKLSNNKYLFTLSDGKNREIRRMIEFANLKIIKLKRINIGKLNLGSLHTGEWKQMSESEIQQSLSTNNLR